MTPELHIRLLGDFALTRADGRPLPPLPERVRLLLAFLLVHRQAPQLRQHIAFQLWPDSTEAQARTNLRNLLHQLRAALPDPDHFLDSSPQTLWWRPDARATLDIASFEAGLQRAREQARGDGASAAEAFEAVLALYRGDLLPGFYAEWLDDHRERLRGDYREALRDLGELYEALGRWSEARYAAQRLVLHDPLDEGATIQLMRASALSGDRAGVQRAYQQCRATLARELEVAPSQAVEEALARWLPYEPPALPPVEAPRLEPTLLPLARQRRIPLPRPATPLVGRNHELAAIGALVRAPTHRLIVLTGPGGMGKTRLALHLANLHEPDFPDGVVWVALDAVPTAAGICAAIATALGLTFHSAQPIEAHLRRILAPARLLLVLDNFEHLLEGEAVLSSLLAGVPGLTMLVTSRGRLELHESWNWEVSGLPIPDAGSEAPWDAGSAPALFVQAARQTRHDFMPGPEARAAIVRLCHLVEGMPLGLELAASWVRLLSPQEIVAEVTRTLDFLATTYRDIPARHRSLQAVFDHSWELLTPEEQGALRRLASFSGGFTREAAKGVAGVSLAGLGALADKSLLRRAELGGDEAAVVRYTLHPVVREYALRHLHADPAEAEATAASHAHTYAALLAARLEALRGPTQRQVLAELQRERDNIRQAWAWAIERGAVGLLGQAARGLWWFYELSGWYQEGLRCFSEATAAMAPLTKHPEQALARGQLLTAQGHFAFHCGRQGEAQAILREAVALARQARHQQVLVEALMALGFIALRVGDYNEAEASLRESLRLSHADFPWEAAMACAYLGSLALRRNRLDEARTVLAESVAAFRALGDPANLAYALSVQGSALARHGAWAEAFATLEEAATLSRAIGDRWGIAFSGIQLGVAAHLSGDQIMARNALTPSLALFEQLGDTWNQATVLDHLGRVALAEGNFAEAAAAWGQALPLAHALHGTTLVLNILFGLGRLAALQGERARARLLLAQALFHPAATSAFQHLATPLLDALAPLSGELPLPTLAATTSLDAAVALATLPT